MQVALTIAGFDPSSGAGVTADLAVFAAHGLFGTSAITTLTVQSTLGVAGAEVVSAELLGRMLDHLWADMPAAGIKIGALGSLENATRVGEFLRGAAEVPVVLDPVVVSSSGRALFPPEDVAALHDVLLPQVGWVTPNWAELALLAGRPVGTHDEAVAAAHALGLRHPGLTVVATGGDQELPVDLLRSPDGAVEVFAGRRVESTSTHGTGCAFSSALMAGLVQGMSAREAVAAAKQYVVEAIERAPGLGAGRGPLGLWR